jgi:hypothetical protein
MKLSLDEIRPFIVILLAILIVVLFGWTLAQAQHNHSAGHDEYKNWFSRDGAACCSSADCGTVKPEDERIEGGQHQIRVEGRCR